MVTISAYNNATDRRESVQSDRPGLRTRTGGVGHTLLVGAELGRQETDNFRATGYFNGTSTSVQAPLSSPTIDTPVTFRQSATDADNHGVASLAAVFAQDQLELTRNLQAVVGLRFDAFDMDFTNNRTAAAFSTTDRMLSPRLGLIYKPVQPLSLYSSYSLTFVPRAGEQLVVAVAVERSARPRGVQELRGRGEVGHPSGAWPDRRRLPPRSQQRRVPDPNDPTLSLLVDAQRTKGLELELTGALTPAWNLTAGYAYQDGTITRSISATAQAGRRARPRAGSLVLDLEQLQGHAALVRRSRRHPPQPRCSRPPTTPSCCPASPAWMGRSSSTSRQAARAVQRREPLRRALLLERAQQQQHHPRLTARGQVVGDDEF